MYGVISDNIIDLSGKSASVELTSLAIKNMSWKQILHSNNSYNYHIRIGLFIEKIYITINNVNVSKKNSCLENLLIMLIDRYNNVNLNFFDYINKYQIIILVLLLYNISIIIIFTFK